MSPTGRTIVIEEDLHVLDAATRELAPRAGGLIARLPADHEAVEAESSVVRSCTPEMTSAAGLRAEMRRLRGDLRDAGEKAGLAGAVHRPGRGVPVDTADVRRPRDAAASRGPAGVRAPAS